nr:DUF1697 domain-containing protein [Corynebacterium lactis]
MRHLLLLRGINVGGKNKVPMADLRAALEAQRLREVSTYINSGNAIFETDEGDAHVHTAVDAALATFPFPIRRVILTREEVEADAAALPEWWTQPLARRDVLFHTNEVDPAQMRARIEAMPLGDEIVHFGRHAVFWGKHTEAEYMRTAYHKYLIKEDFYPLITIRNGRTFDRLLELIG